MIVWKRCGIRFAEAWFDEPAPDGGIDLVCHIQRPMPVPGAFNKEFHTILLDLGSSEDDLFGAMKGSTRYKIRRAAKEGASCERLSPVDNRATLAFCDFFNRFAAQKGIVGCKHSDVVRYASANMLDLSLCRDESGEAVAWHSHIITRGRARLLHSASLSLGCKDMTSRNAIGRANRYLHWQDILRFKATGLAVYDFGGWYAGRTDYAKLRINQFKEGFGGRMVREFNCPVMHTLRGRMAFWLRRIRSKVG